MVNKDMAEITREECMTLVADLWANKYPLVQKYFGKYLSRLIRSDLKETFKGRFINAAVFPEDLETLLHKIDHIGQTKSIVSEVGDIKGAIELDRRLMDAWAELRTIRQVIKEDFTEVVKITEVADLIAKRGESAYAFQVIHINNSLDKHVIRHNEFDKQDSAPEGELSDIYERLEEPVSYFFWDALQEKNAKFKKWTKSNWIRCIVIVSNDMDLQDNLVRHISCRKIREGIHLLSNRYFDELLWLPDMGNGAWFTVGSELNQTRCFADWSDSPGMTSEEKENRVNRQEVNLDRIIPLRNNLI